MKKVSVVLDCDLDGVAGAQKVSFTSDGKPLEIDLCEQHRKDFNSRVAEFAEHARKAPRVAPRRQVKRTPEKRERDAAIRAWAIRLGLRVNERGRLPKDVLAKYDAAH